ELAARLERDRGAAAAEADDRIAVQHRLPAEATQALEQRANAIRALIGHGMKIRAAENEFLVLGADAPFGGGLASRRQILDQLTLVSDRCTARLRRCRHARCCSRRL